MFRSDLLKHVVHGLQGGLTQGINLRSWDISEIYCPADLMFEVLGLSSPLVRLKEGPEWV